jgi:hypothetical protein
MDEPLSESLARLARQQREREGRQAVAGWLRRLADRVLPDETYTSIRARIRFSAHDPSHFALTYTGTRHQEGEAWDEPNSDGVRVYIKRADRDRITRR